MKYPTSSEQILHLFHSVLQRNTAQMHSCRTLSLPSPDTQTLRLVNWIQELNPSSDPPFETTHSLIWLCTGVLVVTQCQPLYAGKLLGIKMAFIILKYKSLLRTDSQVLSQEKEFTRYNFLEIVNNLWNTTSRQVAGSVPQYCIRWGQDLSSVPRDQVPSEETG